ncbi:MAG: DUF4301 family protein [Prevotellaceae bacterium]|jgi:hypothetical protein|nr:DUF4301 family protein [Prevotellaceae bacterium]
MFSKKDIAQLQALGISQSEAGQQIENFKKGFPFLRVLCPATLHKGIRRLDAKEADDLTAVFGSFDGTLLKFTPASGAASRMFKSLFEAEKILAKGEKPDFESKAMKPVKDFFDGLPDFAFYDELKALLANQNISCDNVAGEKTQLAILQTLLDDGGMSYGSLPKGLLKFHRYSCGARTAMEEHLVEAALYVKDKRGMARLHFTVSPEHRALFERLASKVKEAYEKEYGVRYDISFSEQKKSADTIAVDDHNEPFRNADGSILLRPGGHGALIENLNEQLADVVFVKNIDNVAPDSYKPDTARYKKALAGLLLQLRDKVFGYLNALDAHPNEDLLTEIQAFFENELSFVFPKGWESSKLAYLRTKLHRPIRVCGMVRNVGEPGGGPFIAVNPDGSASLQIAESSQLDLSNPETKAIFDSATHFNPVDMVCSFIDYKGNKFDLKKFRDPATGFISLKSKDGRALKAQELPGLWNGAMSDWITALVEVPLSTFNPVKTVNDLLRKEHREQ